MRNITAAAIAASLLAAPLAPPADAATAALVFVCNFRYAASGSMQGTCTVAGFPASGGASVQATWRPQILSGLCPVGEGTSGTVTGTGGLAGFSVDFNMTRLSATGVVTVSGSTNGAGMAAFTNPCTTQDTVAVWTIAGT